MWPLIQVHKLLFVIRDCLYTPSHRQGITYHSFCYSAGFSSSLRLGIVYIHKSTDRYYIWYHIVIYHKCLACFALPVFQLLLIMLRNNNNIMFSKTNQKSSFASLISDELTMALQIGTLDFPVLFLALGFWLALYFLMCAVDPRHSYEWHCRIVTGIHGVLITSMAAWCAFVQGPWPFTDAGKFVYNSTVVSGPLVVHWRGYVCV